MKNKAVAFATAFILQILIWWGVKIITHGYKVSEDSNKAFPHDWGEGVTDAVAYDLEQTIFSEINVKLLLSS